MSTTYKKAKAHADALRAALPELERGRGTHVIWRDCEQRYRDENPDIGDKAFHDGMVKTYDQRISTLKAAADFLEALV